ncbi:MAG: hypothetical protein R2831_09980 [Chitinophagaceae bacterium]
MLDWFSHNELTVDSRGRITIPVSVQKKIGEDKKYFMIKMGYEGSVQLFTMDLWEKEYERMAKSHFENSKDRNFLRHFTYGINQVEMDAAGKILIPAVLREKANLNDKVVLTWQFRYFEIWNKEAHDKFHSDDYNLEQTSDEIFARNNADKKSNE